ncbi:MAG: hypothetical protein ABWZ68_08605 [Acidimicrobiales bacterium]
MRCVRRSLLAAAVASLGLLGVGLSPTAVAAAPTWAPEASATIHPGVQTDTNGGQCTANFIFTAGSDVDIGQAAHCSSTRGQTDTDGCVACSLPLDSQGRALGVLSTLQIAPLPAGNGVGELSHELAYARNHVPALTDLEVVNGTRVFNGSQLPLGL